MSTITEPTWTRIPADIPGESDRRTVLAILADNGLETRIVKVKVGNRIRRFVEYREQAGPEN